MKNSFLIASFLVVLFTLTLQTADARSGCCSHHGGVCGCGCCDGSPLSSTCAPYYPECSNTGSNTTADQATTPTQTTKVFFTSTPTVTLTPTFSPTPTITPT